MPQTLFHSVSLDKTLCKGCTNCLKRCPTEAIRVRGGRAHIIDERCIDCGVCVRVCENHAKIVRTDCLADIQQFKYRIALPAPSLYGQFKGLQHISTVLEALKKVGFDEVFEVARGADVVTRAVNEKLRQRNRPKPLISSACPAVVRLIQVRFPDLIPNIVDIRQPMEIAASMAKQDFCRAYNVLPEDVGVFFITPCAAKVTAIHRTIGQEMSAVNGAISMMEVYGHILPFIDEIDLRADTGKRISVGGTWAINSGETDALGMDNSMAVDGIDNVIHVLEEIENGKLFALDYFEGSACFCGCVGGALTIENNYIAKNNIKRLYSALMKTREPEKADASQLTKYPVYLDTPIIPNGVLKLDDDIAEAMAKLQSILEITESLPGYDCGSCGSPTCRTFAEDIVRGYCRKMDCIHIMKDELKVMAQHMVDLAQTKRE
jgi:iron only hydrogenase large subunit-like protein